MTQELFQTEEKKDLRKKEQLVKRGMLLWNECASEYRMLPFKYLFLLEEKRRLKMTLNRLNMGRIEEYPEITFFRILEAEEARVWLEDKELKELEKELELIEFILTGDHSYRSLKAWVIDATYSLTRKISKIQKRSTRPIVEIPSVIWL